MQIQNFSSIGFNVIGNNFKKPSKVFDMKNDAVSFRGNIEAKSENVKKGEEFGQDLYALYQNGKFNNNTIQTEARKNIPNIKVKGINELGKIFGKDIDLARYNAYLLPSYKSDCSLKEMTIFIRDEKPDIERIASAAHEYTHALQYIQNDDYMGIAPIVNNNLLNARALNSFGFHVFNEMEHNFKIGEIFDKAAKISDEKGIDIKEAFIQAGGFEDEKDCKKAFKRGFLNIYDDVKTGMEHSPDYSYVPLRDDPLALKRAVRTLCKQRAEREQEAYTVQRNVISAIDKDKLSGENKVSPVFYEIMAEALS